ncbi:hypothetical protein HGRIS_005529 [Hohenbuehelia grisea]
MAPGSSSISDEAIPKSIARVLNAAKVREEWKASKRKHAGDGEDHPTSTKKARRDAAGKTQSDKKGKGKEKETELKILPGESIQHFNKRVEDNMRASVKSAMHSSKVVTRHAQRAELEAKKSKKAAKPNPGNKRHTSPNGSDNSDVEAKSKPSATSAREPVKDFASRSTSAPKRLNDIAQAPPEFKNLPRGARKQGNTLPGNSKADHVLSMAQKLMMEQERERVIQKYRELKAQKLAEQSVSSKA